MTVDKPTDDPHYEEHFREEEEFTEHSVSHFFREHWPLVFFTSLFLLMMMFPLVFAGLAEGYGQIPIHALFIFLAFALGLTLVFLKPQLLLYYLGALSLLSFFIIHPAEGTWNASGFYLTAIWLLFIATGIYFFVFRNRDGDGKK